jgi:predicted aspartyl protease
MTVRFPYSPARNPPIPAVVLELTSPDGSRVVSGVSTHLDTAADRTIVPLHLVQQLGLQQLTTIGAIAFGGGQYTLEVYEVGLTIPGVGRAVVRALAHPAEQYPLVGRDFLNYFRVTFDGPNQRVEFH